MKHYILEAGRRQGWSYEFLNDYPYLIKFSKEDLTFYTNRIVVVDVNHQHSILTIDKRLSYLILKEENIPHIIEYEVIESYDYTHLNNLYNKYSEQNSKPVIVKPIMGLGGVGVKKCNTLTEFIKVVLEFDKGALCINTYFEHTTELRFLIINRKLALIHTKLNNPTNLIRPKNNYQHIPLSKIREMKEIAMRSANAMHLDVVAIDFLVNADNEFSLLELNSNPNFSKIADLNASKFEKIVKIFEISFKRKEFLLRNRDY